MPTPWLVTVAISSAVDLPATGPTDRDGFIEWLWTEFADGELLALDEGSVDAEAAWAAGLADSALVIDTAAAPVERDWVAAAGGAEMILVFAGEQAAERAAALLTTLTGVRLGAVRQAPPSGQAPVQEPVAVPGFGWIVPPGCEADLDDTAAGTARVVLDAGIGFGTGLHLTTRLCLRALAAHAAAGRPLGHVLDVGAGSGILGIAAACAGAADVVAVEIDSRVHGAIAANAAHNGVADRVRVERDLADLPAGPPFDLVMANIVAAVLVGIADRVCARLARPGSLVLSGLPDEEAAPVAAEYRRRLGIDPRAMTDAGWTCLIFHR
ncbi:MAG: methyltransferase domain-containing protein [Planctomycetes bacterium]|nr:methyltransferase domain-containing protein [Planctomycetota bacterium]MBM4056699.1 methyltransferase domain-containing protein [Planctomycetota bacterium]